MLAQFPGREGERRGKPTVGMAFKSCEKRSEV